MYDCVYVILPKEYKNLCLYFSLLQPSRMTVYWKNIQQTAIGILFILKKNEKKNTHTECCCIGKDLKV